jgi:hypothetical protein
MEVVTFNAPSLHLILQRSFQPDLSASAKLNHHHQPTANFPLHYPQKTVLGFRRRKTLRLSNPERVQCSTSPHFNPSTTPPSTA